MSMEIDNPEEKESAVPGAEQISNLIQILTFIEEANNRTKESNQQSVDEKITEIRRVANTLKSLIDSASNSIISKLQNELSSDATEFQNVNTSIINNKYKSQLQSMSPTADLSQIRKEVFLLQKNPKTRLQALTLTAAADGSLQALEQAITSYFSDNFVFARSDGADSNDFMNQIDWTWDYCNKLNSESTSYKADFEKKHKMKASDEGGDKKTLLCNVSDNYLCDCFFRINHGMHPNSGVYKIKMRIDKMTDKRHGANIIGLTSSLDANNNAEPKGKPWWCSNDYIGWCHYSGNKRNNTEISMSGGLFCSGSEDNIENNLFYRNNIRYFSNNEYFKQRLPPLIKGDVVVMEYNSNERVLAVKKENKDELGQELDSYIHNLPKNTVFYWFAGHCNGKMKITILP